MVELGQLYLDTAIANFEQIKRSGERAMEQLDIDEMHFAPSVESNSIASIVKHLSGNMRSRWTNFLISDGEKPWRDRENEFVARYATREALTSDWNEGWNCLFGALRALHPEDLTQTITIRTEPHVVLAAIERQVAHVSHHIGQMVYLAKQIRDGEWKSLSIPRGQSNEFLAEMQKKFGDARGHKPDGTDR